VALRLMKLRRFIGGLWAKEFAGGTVSWVDKMSPSPAMTAQPGGAASQVFGVRAVVDGSARTEWTGERLVRSLDVKRGMKGSSV